MTGRSPEVLATCQEHGYQPMLTQLNAVKQG
jgi:hypothetical protein